MNPSYQRVMAACAFQPPDRIPRYDKFWSYPEEWQQRFGPAHELTDVWILPPDETPFPSQARVLSEDGEDVYSVDSWGRRLRSRQGAYFTETLTVPIPDGTDPNIVEFDPPAADRRFSLGCATEADTANALAVLKARSAFS
jgi:hypothetical protein